MAKESSARLRLQRTKRRPRQRGIDPQIRSLDIRPVVGMAHKMLLHDAGEQNVPIILTSGNPELPAIARRKGTPYFVAKPFGIVAFLELLNRALIERRAPSSA